MVSSDVLFEGGGLMMSRWEIRCAEGYFREASHGHDDFGFGCHSDCCSSTGYFEWIKPFFPHPFVSFIMDVFWHFGFCCWCKIADPVFGVRLQTLFCWSIMDGAGTTTYGCCINF